MKNNNSPKKLITRILILAILLLLVFPSSASAGKKLRKKIKCIVNPKCWIEKLIPTVGVDVHAKLENPEQLKELIDYTSKRLEQLAEQAAKTGNQEMQKTIEKARQELEEYTQEVDQIVAKHIADIDKRVGNRVKDTDQRVEARIDQLDAVTQARLLQIQEITEQLNIYAKENIELLSQKAQETLLVGEDVATSIIGEAEDSGFNVIDHWETATTNIVDQTGNRVLSIVKAAGDESKSIAYVFGAEGRSIVKEAGFESRLTIISATEAGLILSNRLEQLMDKAQDVGKGYISDAERSRLKVIKGTLYVITQSADLALLLVGLFLGIVILSLCSMVWGPALLKDPLPTDSLRRGIVVTYIGVPFILGLACFSLVKPEVRYYFLVEMRQVKPYANNLSGDVLEVKPYIFRFDPEIIVIENSNTTTLLLVVHGSNLLSQGTPTAKFGHKQLELLGSSENQLSFDLASVSADPQLAKRVVIQFNPSEGSKDSYFNTVAVIQSSKPLERQNQIPSEPFVRRNIPTTPTPVAVPSSPVTIPETPIIQPSPNNDRDLEPPPNGHQPPIIQPSPNHHLDSKPPRTIPESYQGETDDQGIPDGLGTYLYPNGDKYQGRWFHGKRYGQGAYHYSDGSQYDGEWYEDERHGQGIMRYPDGTKKEGRWLRGQFQE